MDIDFGEGIIDNRTCTYYHCYSYDGAGAVDLPNIKHPLAAHVKITKKCGCVMTLIRNLEARITTASGIVSFALSALPFILPMSFTLMPSSVCAEYISLNGMYSVPSGWIKADGSINRIRLLSNMALFLQERTVAKQASIDHVINTLPRSTRLPPFMPDGLATQRDLSTWETHKITLVRSINVKHGRRGNRVAVTPIAAVVWGLMPEDCYRLNDRFRRDYGIPRQLIPSAAFFDGAANLAISYHQGRNPTGCVQTSDEQYLFIIALSTGKPRNAS